MSLERSSLASACALAMLCTAASAQTVTRVSVASSGAQANGLNSASALSSDGRFVAFQSSATNLVQPDANFTQADIFLHDRVSAITTLVSKSSAGVQASSGSFFPVISANGRSVAFTTTAALVADDTNGNFFADVYVHDVQTGATSRASVGTGGTQAEGFSQSPALSADGRFVAFASSADNLVANDVNGYDIFVHDRQTLVTTLVHVDSNGVQGIGDSGSPVLSADGRFVAFHSHASNLDPTDTNDQRDVFVHDTQTGTTLLVSRSTAGAVSASASENPSISADGRYVAFDTAGALDPADTNGTHDVYVHDVLTGTTTRVSVSTAGMQGCCKSDFARITPDGRFIAFTSLADDLVPGDANAAPDVLVRDMLRGTTLRVDYGTAGVEPQLGGFSASISDDGRFVGFHSKDAELVAGDTNRTFDVFLRDRGAPLAPSSFCFGDGLDPQVTTPCPCGNSGAPGHGCGNSAVAGGALLSADGVQPDELQLTIADMPPGVASIYLQGDALAAAGIVFGDGLRCADGNLVRLAVRVDADFDGTTTLGPQSGDVQVLIAGHVLDGATHAYQTYYRNPDPGWCPPATFNISQALSITW